MSRAEGGEAICVKCKEELDIFFVLKNIDFMVFQFHDTCNGSKHVEYA